MKELSLHPDAILEAAAARLWYVERSKDAARKFMDEFDGAITSIVEAPEKWPAPSNGRRRYVMKRFPFIIWYHVREADVRVLAIAHARRRPGCWMDRV